MTTRSFFDTSAMVLARTGVSTRRMRTFLARYLMVICTMFLLATNARAATANDANAPLIIGAGALSCGQWLTDRQGLYSAQTIEAWITGYLSGFNAYVFHGDMTNHTDNADLFSWIDDYCHAHPLDDIAAATDRLIDALKAR
jgi:hypothetical protein